MAEGKGEAGLALRSEGDLTLRRASRTDAPAIAALIRAVFPDNPKADPAVLDWQYWQNPAGPAVSWVWTRGDRLVSHFAVLPYHAVADGKSVLVGKSADAATLPGERGRGLFPRAAQAVLDDLGARGGLGVLFSPSNPASRRALDKVGLVAVSDPVPAWAGPAGVVARAVDGGSAGARGLVRPDPDQITALWRTTAARTAGLRVRHDGEWFTWRYGRPAGDYVVRGLAGADGLEAVVALRRRDFLGVPGLAVLDWLATTPRAGARVLARTVRETEIAPYSPVLTIALEGRAEALLARAAGLRRVPDRLLPRRFMLGTIATPGHALPPGATIQWADLDHI